MAFHEEAQEHMVPRLEAQKVKKGTPVGDAIKGYMETGAGSQAFADAVTNTGRVRYELGQGVHIFPNTKDEEGDFVDYVSFGSHPEQIVFGTLALTAVCEEGYTVVIEK